MFFFFLNSVNFPTIRDTDTERVNRNSQIHLLLSDETDWRHYTSVRYVRSKNVRYKDYICAPKHLSIYISPPGRTVTS